MVGNDVVDLRDRETAPGVQHPRFKDRVFTKDEIKQIEDSSNPHQTRWQIWAAKESAYKLAKRIDPREIFSHQAFETTIEKSFNSGRVQHKGRDFFIQLQHIEDAIHAVCTIADGHQGKILAAVGRIHSIPKEIRSNLVEFEGTPSEAVRQLAVDTMAEHFEVPPETLEIISDANRVPYLRVQREEYSADLSLAHHGRYIAFACIPRHASSRESG